MSNEKKEKDAIFSKYIFTIKEYFFTMNQSEIIKPG